MYNASTLVIMAKRDTLLSDANNHSSAANRQSKSLIFIHKSIANYVVLP